MKLTVIIFVFLAASFSIVRSTVPWTPGKSTRDLPVVSSGKIRFSMDFAGYQVEDGQVFEEFYFRIPYSVLRFKCDEEGYVALVGITLEIISTQGKGTVLWVDRWKNHVAVEDTTDAALRDLYFFDLNGTTLIPGEYRVRAVVEDLFSGNTGTGITSFRSPGSVSEEELGLSDIHFSHEIKRASGSNVLNKEDYLIIPNTQRTYSRRNPFLYIYLEIYNLAVSTSADSSAAKLSYSIIDSHGKEVKIFDPREVTGRSRITTEMGMLNIASLQQGDYFLKAEIFDPLTGRRAAAKRLFRFLVGGSSPGTSFSSSSTGSDPLLKMLTDAEVDEYGRHLQYIVTPMEHQRFKSLNTTGKRRFIEEYWSKRDPDRTTEVNEALREHIARFSHVTHIYGSWGWKTDRGRIFIMHGKPDEVVRNSFPLKEREYEEWYYRREKVMYFRFEDIAGFGEFDLTDSSERSELGGVKKKSFLR